MSTNLTVATTTAHGLQFTDEQISLIKAMVAEKATDNELKLFLHQCSRTGLDPMTRQIYCIHRGGKMTIQTSIDGFRVVAERSGAYAGQAEPDYIYNADKALIGCKVTVFKFSPRGDRYPAAVGVAYWAEYAQTSGLWSKMPHTMIAKVAEALALRKAFPQDLSGLYTTDEMEQANEGQEVRSSFKYSLWMQNELEQLLATSTYQSGSKEFASIQNTIAMHNLPEATYNRVKAGLQANQLSPMDRGNMSATEVNKAVQAKAQAEDIDFETIAKTA